MKKIYRFLIVPSLLLSLFSVSCDNKSVAIYEDDNEDICVGAATRVVCDYNSIVNPPLLKKIDMYNAGCVRPISNYQRDLEFCKEMNPQSLRMDISIGKESGNAGMYLVGDEYDIFDYDSENETYKVDKNSLTYDFKDLDEVFSYFKQIDTLPYVSWCYIPFPLAYNGKFNNLDNNILNWQEVWEEIYYNYAKHYKENGTKIGYHELYNEPDLEILKIWGVLDEDDQYFLNLDDFAPNGKPADGCYHDMYEYGVKGILRADPDATVGGPAFALGELGVADWVDFLPRLSRKNLPIDFYSFHSYLDGDTWYKSDAQRANHKKNELELVVDGIQKDPHFLTTQVHINEYSCLNNENGALSGINAPFNFYTGASNTLDAVFEVVDRTSVQLVSWAQLLSVNNLQNDPYGLITQDGQPKAAFNALRIYQDMPVWRYEAKVSEDNGIKCVTSSSKDKVSIVLWNTGSATDEEGMYTDVNDKVVDLKVENAKFNQGTRRIYRIDRNHASYYDKTKTSYLSEQNVRNVSLEDGTSVWKGVVPAGSVVYVTINKNGQKDFELAPRNNFANDIKTEYWYEDRYRDLKGSREEYEDFVSGASGSYSLFDRKTWKMYLGMGSLEGNGNGKYVGQGVANGAVTCDNIPETFKIKIDTDKRARQMNSFSSFGVRIDFYNDETEKYEKSVYLHNGVYTEESNPNEQDNKLSGLSVYPWGTKDFASENHQYQGNTWDVDLKEFAPSGWLNGSRRAIISFDMRNASSNARAAIQLIK